MRFEHCNWREIESRVKRDNRIVLVLGATEEHADLSVCTDTLIAWEIALRACLAEDVLLAPPLPFGISSWASAYPGTISLRVKTLVMVFEDIIRSLLNCGFRTFFVINGHGQNKSVIPVFNELCRDYSDARIKFLQWWEIPQVRELCNKFEVKISHANWVEAFPFTMMNPTRIVVPHERPMPDLLMESGEIRKKFGEGHGPGPVYLGEDIAEELLEAAVTGVRQILRECDVPDNEETGFRKAGRGI